IVRDSEAQDRIEAAARAAKERDEFIASLGPNDEIVKPIYNPEAWIIRDKAKAAASRGEILPGKCPHPLTHIRQVVDSDPAIRRKDRPVNLFRCELCDMPCWLVSPWGEPLGDNV
ncbi:MAG: hypothetical protein KGL39_28330, partial [Patescibacteria group bacterium]|nr:hypothetical protein [Patescibacteria group bacterium]